jgi:two-component system, sensor histidine kinase
MAAPTLLDDPRIRAVVTANLFRGAFVGPMVVATGLAVVWWQLASEPRGPWLALLVGSSVVWAVNSWVYLALYFYRRTLPAQVLQLPERTVRDLRLFLRIRYIDYAATGLGAPLIFWLRPDTAMLLVLGMLMYLYVAFIKNVSYAPATQYQSAVMLTPLSLALAASGQAMLVSVAVFFTVNTLCLFVYARHIAQAFQLPIAQRFELEELAEQLKLESQRADAANEAKSRFFTAASHDARQPLQAISLLFASFQQSTQASPDDQKIIQKIDVNLTVIRSLFDRVLDISRIDAGAIRPQLQRVCLQSHFDKLDAQFGELAASKGLWLRFAATRAVVLHDPELLDRMVSNLVHNAIKYTERGGVWVGWRASRGHLEVRDSGQGIAFDDHAGIFGEFAQLGNPARNNERGLGLGLSIVKRLADLTATPLGLRSALDAGSTFWLQLTPASAAPAGPDIAPRAPLQAQRPASTQPLQGMHLLYAEDDAELLELFTALLRQSGATVYACADLAQARAVLRSDVPLSAVLSDYRLGPDGTGLELVEEARLRHGPALAAVMLTGDTAAQDLSAMGKIQLTLLHKPVSSEQLVAALQAASIQRQ